MVHKDIINRRSPFFEAACSDRRRDSEVGEGQSGKVELPGTDPKISTYASSPSTRIASSMERSRASISARNL